MNGMCTKNPWCKTCWQKKYTIKFEFGRDGIVHVKKYRIVNLFRCKCKKISYCSKKCQKLHWSTQHRWECDCYGE